MTELAWTLYSGYTIDEHSEHQYFYIAANSYLLHEQIHILVYQQRKT